LEEEFDEGEVFGVGEFGVGVGVFDEGDGVTEGGNGGGVVGDAEVFEAELAVGFDDEFAGEDLGSFHGPEGFAAEVAEAEAAEAAAFADGGLLDGVGSAVGEDGGFVAHDDVEEGAEVVGGDEGTGAVVNEDVIHQEGEIMEAVVNGVLAFLAADGEEGGGGGEVERGDGGGNGGLLPGVANDEHVVFDDGGFAEGAEGVFEGGAASEWGEDFVGDSSLHAGALARAEQDGGVEHGGGKEFYREGAKMTK